MATFTKYKMGIGNVGSYQVSGYPYVSGSSITKANSGDAADAQHQYTFPKVAKSVTVFFESGAPRTHPLRIHYNATGSGNVISKNHFIPISGAAGTSVTLNAKCAEIYISRADATGDGSAETLVYKIFAELTNIPTGEMSQITGSGLTE